MSGATAGLLALLLTPPVLLLAAAAARGRQRIRVTVDGSSMEPTLGAGQTVIAHRSTAARLRRGQVVILVKPTAPGTWRWPRPSRRPHRQALLVKRLAALPGDPLPPGVPAPRPGVVTVPAGFAAVLGDNAASSTDSRAFGLVPLDRIVARLTAGSA
ncbi:S26 family signal peptidase [Streptomyces sp. NPDC052644]